MGAADLTFEQSGDGVTLRFAGQMVTEALGSVEEAMRHLPKGPRRAAVDLSQVESLDTGGAWVVVTLLERLKADGIRAEITGATEDHLALIDTIRRSLPEPLPVEDRDRGLVAMLVRLGEATVGAGAAAASLLEFLGLTLHRLAMTLLRPWRLRGTALVRQIEEVGFKALPIVALMGFLIGVVLAFQGAAQLRQFGAEVFVVELIAISILRELGIILTAIIVAGRSGSAFTASIGSMKIREELDAMRTLGLDPIEVLVLPRVIALIIALPILGFVANVAGLFGGALMSWIELGISPGMFVTRLGEGIDVWHLGVGMVKAPFFALIIGVVACWQATLVSGSSESVGQRTTISVVQSIFLVIAADALFSIFFSELGI